MHASNEDIERWSTKIREACAKHAEYLEPGDDGTQGQNCCARGAVVFKPDIDDRYMEDITIDEVLYALGGVTHSNASQSLVDFLAGVASGFDEQAYYDAIRETAEYKKGQALGAEMRAKYLTQVKP